MTTHEHHNGVLHKFITKLLAIYNLLAPRQAKHDSCHSLANQCLKLLRFTHHVYALLGIYQIIRITKDLLIKLTMNIQ